MSSFNRKPKGDSNYYQHDDRGTKSFHTRRVSFKNTSRQQGWDSKIRRYIEDGGDVDMTVNVRNRSGIRFNPLKGRGGGGRGGGGGGGGRGGGNFKGRGLQDGPSNWFKVTLCHGKKYNRQEVMKTIQNYIQPVPFTPIAVKLEDDDMTFFVDNFKTANSINAANFRLQMRDGWKMQIKVKSEMPYVELNPSLKEKIKQVMSSQYDPTTQHLDLSRFYANEEFLKNDIFVPLNRQNMLLAVFQIIVESVPNLRSLNLSDNKIFATEHFPMLKKHTCELKKLDLSKNRITDLGKLSCLEGLKLESLVLDCNPLCDQYQDQTKYVREVRKIFRTLLVLDGVELPPPVSFDIEENQCKLPTSQGDFLCNVEGREFTKQFIEQFYVMYDSRLGRDALSEAYADNAQFSMAAFNLSGVNLNKYITESRNLKKVLNFERRSKLLRVGKAEIVRYLNTLPKTQHDLASFTVDLLVFTPQLISLCICGVFREAEYSPTAIKAFSRAFTLIPTGTGFNIVNDVLSITDASKEQAAGAFAAQSTSNATPLPPVPSAEEMELIRKREMITALASQTGMNLEWSEKCLKETNWDFNRALYAFTEFNKLGKIPKEAFGETKTW